MEMSSSSTEATVCQHIRSANHVNIKISSYCLPALPINATCTFANSSDCQILTQGTQCTSGKCSCIRVVGSENFFNGSSCVPAFTIFSPCAHNDQCQLLTQFASCINGFCNCTRFFGNERIFSGTECVLASPYENYCTKTSDCQYMTHNLTCINGACLCYRVVNDENYYNGSYCVPCKFCNDPCTSNVACQSLTFDMICTNTKCSCLGGVSYDVAKGRCADCHLGWVFSYGKCYKKTSVNLNCSSTLSTNAVITCVGNMCGTLTFNSSYVINLASVSTAFEYQGLFANFSSGAIINVNAVIPSGTTDVAIISGPNSNYRKCPIMLTTTKVNSTFCYDSYPVLCSYALV